MTVLTSSTPENTLLREAAEQQADMCRLFANPHRVLILWLLETGERTVGELAAALDLSMPGTSQHLQRLKASDVVSTRRDGKLIYYGLTDDMGEQCRRLFGTDASWR